MFNLHCTKKLLDRMKPAVEPPGPSTTAMGNWYATAWFWRPQLALLVNEKTLLPVVMPLAPVASLAQRFPDTLARVLRALDVDPGFIEAELAQMNAVTCCKTVNRSVVGMLNQFSYLAEGYHEHFGLVDPLAMSLKLAGTPCSPLYKEAVCPDLAVRALVAGRLTP